ncbi:YolD-like family protein [Bacillus sp. XF8]|uniref:YolD-like family protein n=1 Tax=Bacillus sp. XF8 TaxID=2819289 RepID=UPI001AA0A4DB|nr:YolD-like family protein [Bacillus sp. XF8]MBO1582988.1 YolD-like family protein [Bacillus sp. XF8]
MENWGVPKVRCRGMVKWQPFASMPEQYEGINRILEEQYKVPKPFLTDDTKERIERALNESLQQSSEILVSYYRDGYIHEDYITITNIDVQTKTIGCTDAFGLNSKFKIDEFVDVK